MSKHTSDEVTMWETLLEVGHSALTQLRHGLSAQPPLQRGDKYQCLGPGYILSTACVAAYSAGVVALAAAAAAALVAAVTARHADVVALAAAAPAAQPAAAQPAATAGPAQPAAVCCETVACALMTQFRARSWQYWYQINPSGRAI
eukprot:scaffold76231_cov34-Phaeocystis_antarctica.AAC.1